MEKNLRYLPISTGVRPAKVAVLVKIDSIYWKSDCLAIIAMFNRTWGGEYNLIIPTDGNTIDSYFIEILKEYDPDYLYYFVSTIQQLKSFDTQRFSELDHPGFLSKEISDFKISKQLQMHLKDNLQIFNHSKIQTIPPLTYNKNISFPLTDIKNIVKYSGIDTVQAVEYAKVPSTQSLLIHSNMGLVDEFLEETLSSNEINVIYEEYKNDDDLYRLLDCLYEREKVFNKKNYGFNISSSNLEYYSDSIVTEESPPIMVLGETISDFCLYYCLSRLKQRVYWIPTKTGFDNELKTIINIRRKELKFETHKNMYLTSCSMQDLEINNVLSQMENGFLAKDMLPYVIEHNITLYIKNILYIYNKDNHTNKLVLLFDSDTNQSIYSINTPIPLGFTMVPPYGHFWITDIFVENTLFPKNQNIVNELLTTHNYNSRTIRITNKGISYFSPNDSYFNFMGQNVKLTKVDPYFKYPDIYKLFETLFQSSGLYIKKSDKGNFEEVFIEKFDGIDNSTEVLLYDGYRMVFEKFIDDDYTSKPGVYTNGVVINKRRYLDSDTILHLLKDIEVVSIIMNNLLNKNIIERGFIFKCKSCRNADWYNISKVDDTFECTRCYEIQKYTSHTLQLQPEMNRLQPIWYYKINEMIYQAYLNNSLVPILTLHNLKKLSRTSFEYIPEIEIRKNINSPKPTMEIDICCVVDGNIVIGECKKGTSLKDGQYTDEDIIKKYLKLAKSIGAHMLVFSTISKWSNSTLKLLMKYECESTHVKFIILQGEDLLND